VQEETKETKEMMAKKVKERKRMLRCQLDRIKEGMEAMKAEMEWVKKEVDVLGQWG
jgi:septation ring formation regulator EzrA